MQEASAFAEEKNMIYYETSAKQNTNVMALFEEIGALCLSCHFEL